jgi:nucleoside-diphosphate-sugar epimerase
MRALVTGATGFIGGRLTKRLLERGDDVRLLVRRPEAARAFADRGATICRGDMCDEGTFPDALEDVDVVFHCAGLAADWGPRRDFERINVDGARSLAQAAARKAAKPRFVHISTTDVYGYPKHACGDDGPTRDTGLPYNSTKLRGEVAVRAVANETKLPLIVVRPATVYGPGSKDLGTEMARLLRRREMMVVAGGAVPAGLVYVDNLVDALLAAAERDVAVGSIYTVRDQTNETWRQYLDALADGLGVPRVKTSLPYGVALALGAASEAACTMLRLKSRPLVTRHAVQILGRDQCYGIDRAMKDLGFRSRVSFEEGMRRTVSWLRERPLDPVS